MRNRVTPCVSVVSSVPRTACTPVSHGSIRSAASSGVSPSRTGSWGTPEVGPAPRRGRLLDTRTRAARRTTTATSRTCSVIAVATARATGPVNLAAAPRSDGPADSRRRPAPRRTDQRPSSISAWLKSPTRFAGNNSSASCHRSFCVAVSCGDLRTANSRKARAAVGLHDRQSAVEGLRQDRPRCSADAGQASPDSGHRATGPHARHQLPAAWCRLRARR